MGLFGESFDKKVAGAIEKLNSMSLGVKDLNATVEGKVVTLSGVVQSPEAKARVMSEFNALVETENTLNLIRVIRPEPAPVAAPPMTAEAMPAAAAAIAMGATAGAPAAAKERWHEVVKGETLSKIAQQYYGDAGRYRKIFDANRDVLDNPDLIKVGQRLRIPE